MSSNSFTSMCRGVFLNEYTNSYNDISLNLTTLCCILVPRNHNMLCVICETFATCCENTNES